MDKDISAIEKLAENDQAFYKRAAETIRKKDGKLAEKLEKAAEKLAEVGEHIKERKA